MNAGAASAGRGARGCRGTVVSARSVETEDTTIVHLAVGWNTGQFKIGSLARSERMAKWSEGLRIEEALGGSACVTGRRALPIRQSRAVAE